MEKSIVDPPGKDPSDAQRTVSLTQRRSHNARASVALTAFVSLEPDIAKRVSSARFNWYWILRLFCTEWMDVAVMPTDHTTDCFIFSWFSTDFLTSSKIPFILAVWGKQCQLIFLVLHLYLQWCGSKVHSRLVDNHRFVMCRRLTRRWKIFVNRASGAW